MDLVSSIRKSGSRGGVNFSWDEVAGSSHRENYLGHSLMAPVGRWQKGKDLSWYAKADGSGAPTDETDEERAARERREEIKRIKEAEEDALAKALGLPPPVRTQTGANSVEVGKPRIGPEPDEGKNLDTEDKALRRHRGDPERRHRRSHRSRSRSRDRRRHRSPHRGGERDGRHRRRSRDRSPRREPEQHHRRRDERLSDRRERTHDADRKETRPRKDHRHRSSRSPAAHGRREDGRRRGSSQSPPPRRQSRSPGYRERP